MGQSTSPGGSGASEVVASLPGPVVLVDASGRVVQANVAATEILGDLDAGAGLSSLGCWKLDPQGPASVAAALAAPGRSSVVPARRPCGLPALVEVTVGPSSGGDARQQIVGLRDVSEEFRRTTLNSALTERVTHLARFEVAPRMAGWAAHELNNLLAATSLYSSLLQDLLGELTAALQLGDAAAALHRSAQAEEFLAAIDEATHGAADLVSHLRVVGGRDAALRTRFSFNVLLAGLKVPLARAAGPRRLEFDLAPSPQVLGSRQQLAYVVEVLASHAGTSGDGPVVVRTGRARNEGRRCATVEVTGLDVELTDAVAARAHDPFGTSCLSPVWTPDVAAVLGVVLQHDGTVSVPDPGTVTVSIPETHDSMPSVSEALPSGRGQTVLVAGGPRAVREAAHQLLSHHHYLTLVCATPAAALVVLADRDLRVDLVVVDGAVLLSEVGMEAAVEDEIAKLRPGLRTVSLDGLLGVADEPAAATQDGSGPWPSLSPQRLLGAVADALTAS